MRVLFPLAKTVAGVLAASVIAGCGSGVTAPKQAQPVTFRLAAAVPAVASGGSSLPLELTKIGIVVRQASLGSGTEFGCHDCQDNVSEAEPQPSLIDVPVGGGTVAVATEQVQPGRYGEVEIEVVLPISASVIGIPGWTAGTTMKVDGRYNGQPFTLTLAIEGNFRQTLSPALNVSAIMPAAIDVTMTLPITSWFTANGVLLDPNDPVQRAQIVASASRSFDPPESGGEVPER